MKIARACLFWGVVFGLILVGTVWKHPVGLSFATDLGSKVPNLLGSLLIVSLFVERVIEVFVSIWRDPATDTLEQELDNAQDLQATRQREILELLAEAKDPATPAPRQTEITALLSAKRKEKEDSEKNEEDIKKKLVPYNANTRRVSTWVGMAIGTLASAAGFRFFNQIVDVGTLIASPVQNDFFICVDVLLTGAILAGGSKSIHQIFSLYDTFMESTRQRTDKAGH